MFNRRGLIKSLLATPLLSLFKPKVEAAITAEEKVPGLNYPEIDIAHTGIPIGGSETTLMYRGYEIRGSG